MTSTPDPTRPPTGITIHDYGAGATPGPDEPTWDTEALRRDYEVLGFQAPYVVVRRRSDGVPGSLEFQHRPRIYWGFTPEVG